MCEEHGPRGVSRRGLGAMLAGAAGMSLLPLAARAGQVDTLCITCIDYRFVNKDVTWLNTELGLDFNNYDIVALAGASLAGIPTRVPQKPDALWNQVVIAKDLHHIQRVVLLDHMDCGAYRVAFGEPPPPPSSKPVLSEADELKKHKEVLPQVAQILRGSYGIKSVSSYIMPLKGMPIPVPG